MIISLYHIIISVIVNFFAISSSSFFLFSLFISFAFFLFSRPLHLSILKRIIFSNGQSRISFYCTLENYTFVLNNILAIIIIIAYKLTIIIKFRIQDFYISKCISCLTSLVRFDSTIYVNI